MDLTELLREAMDKQNILENGNEPMTMVQLQRFAELVLEEAATVARTCDFGPIGPNVSRQRALTADAIRALTPRFSDEY